MNMTTKTKKKAATKKSTSAKSGRWNTAEKIAVFQTMSYAAENRGVASSAGVNPEVLISALAKLRALGYGKLEAAPAKA